ncbi:MAG: DUF423 domain-containing protein [Candidatus Eisenbacteria bacterium]|uniref:DUF423 domain-containing protein n=1 Tax=Eiseniibacteriota bacterium TaxID=2212470 RepID=A0A956NGD2_UNCEI|nr:DUF423 domain-containing protein [Candidatus Eisenbacteria bacterium]
MRRRTVAIGAILGMLAVSAGAFGAHALKAQVTPERLEVFKTAAHYQLIHAVLLVAVGLAGGKLPGRATDIGVLALFGGILVFSGSLYLLVLTDTPMWGAVTPIGGVLFHVGWICIAISALRSRPM